MTNNLTKAPSEAEVAGLLAAIQERCSPDAVLILRRLCCQRDRLHEATVALLPLVEHLECCEAAADDGWGDYLRRLRRTVNLGRAALEGGKL